MRRERGFETSEKKKKVAEGQMAGGQQFRLRTDPPHCMMRLPHPGALCAWWVGWGIPPALLPWG